MKSLERVMESSRNVLLGTVPGATPTMHWTTSVLLALGVAWLLAYLWRRKGFPSLKKKLPPGPIGLPIIGNLNMLGELPHHDFHRLAKQYGSIMCLRLGFVPTIVVSSPQAAEQFLRTHDLVFAGRPRIQAAQYFSYGFRGLSISEYGSYWRNTRKLCTLQLLSQSKVDSFKTQRKEELGLLVQSIKELASVGAMVDLSAKVGSLIAGMTCRMIFGRKFSDRELNGRGFKAVIEETMQLSAAFNLADFIPLVGVLDLQGLNRRMKTVSKVLDDFLEMTIEEHIRDRAKGHQRDFIDVLLSLLESNTTEFQVDRATIKALTMDMLVGGIDTTATAIDWAISELLRRPHMMKKVQEEIDSVVGKERLVEESDLVHLEYLEMVVKETLRLHPVGPLLIPHEAMEDCEVNGYHIPRKSRVIINVWSIGRDPSAWADAEKFLPERFIGTTIDMKGHDFRLLPFGSGRRGCPGIQLGLTMVRLVLAQLVHYFNWELPNGVSPNDLDMSEVFGITTPRATPLLAIPTSRLSSDNL